MIRLDTLKLYCGGNFEFQYKDFTPDKLKSDYRTDILGSVDLILHQPKSGSVTLFCTNTLGVEYIGPFYFYENGLDGACVVSNECDMVERCTHAVFLVDNKNIPGTVSEIIHASLLKKNVAIFYVEKTPDAGEPEQDICNTNWYPLEFAKLVNEKTKLIKCKNRKEAKKLIKEYVKQL